MTSTVSSVEEARPNSNESQPLEDRIAQEHSRADHGGKLVDTRRDAQQIYYRLMSAEVERILQTLYDIYCDPQAKTAEDASALAGSNTGT